MPFKETFSEFYSKVKISLADGTFAKLTMAKTIGNTQLMNIYVRPIIDEEVLKLELKFKFQQEELIEIYTIEKAFDKFHHSQKYGFEKFSGETTIITTKKSEYFPPKN